MNALEIELRIVERSPLRYTPAGLPCQEALAVVDADSAKAFGVRLIAFDTAAMQLAGLPMGVDCRIRGRLQGVPDRASQARDKRAGPQGGLNSVVDHSATPRTVKADRLRIVVEFAAANGTMVEPPPSDC